MLILDAAEDSERLMREWGAVVLSTSTLDRERRKDFFVRGAGTNDRIVHKLLCLVAVGPVKFREYAHERVEWYDRGHFEADHNGLRIRIGLHLFIRESSLVLRFYRQDQEVLFMSHPAEMIRSLYWLIRGKVKGPELSPAIPAEAQKEWENRRAEEERVCQGVLDAL